MNNQILKALYFQSPQSIADMSKSLNKSIPLITKSVNSLIEMNLIEENGLAASTGGRRAIRYQLAQSLEYYTLIIVVDQLYTSVYIYDLNNNIIDEISEQYNPLTSESEALKNIITYTERLFNHSKLEREKILGIGISMPGFIDNKKGINDSYSVDSKLYHIRKRIEEHFKIPCIIENDSTCIAFAEQKFGAAKNINSALVINLNWGVGLGIIVNNQMFKGSSGYAGEFSHIPLSNKNELCACGKKGCLEVEASLTAALKHVKNAIASGENSNLELLQDNILAQGDSLLDQALKGDQLAISSLGKIAYMLGKGMATLIHILNPEYIVISGRGSKAGKILLPQIQTAMNDFCIPRLAKVTKIKISTLYKHAQSLGTTALVIENNLEYLMQPYNKINH